MNHTPALLDPIDNILKRIDRHPRILKIRKRVKDINFSFSYVNYADITYNNMFYHSFHGMK